MTNYEAKPCAAVTQVKQRGLGAWQTLGGLLGSRPDRSPCRPHARSPRSSLWGQSFLAFLFGFTTYVLIPWVELSHLGVNFPGMKSYRASSSVTSVFYSYRCGVSPGGPCGSCLFILTAGEGSTVNTAWWGPARAAREKPSQLDPCSSACVGTEPCSYRAVSATG